MMKYSIFLVSLMLSVSSTALAQQTKRSQAVEAGQMDSASGLTGSGFQLNVGSDTSTITATVAREIDLHSQEGFKTRNFSLSATAPLETGSTSGSFITNTGLTNAVGLKVSISQVSGSIGQFGGSEDFKIKLRDKVIAACKRKKESGISYQDTNCDKLDRHLWSKEMTPEERAIFFSSKIETPLFYYGASAEIGYKEFEYLSPVGFTENSTDKTPYSASAFWGVAPDNSALYIGAGANHKVEYKDADAKTICPVATDLAQQECKTNAFEKPQKNKDTTLFALARYQTDVPVLGSESFPIAVELRAGYDFEDNTFGIAAPIYLFTNEKGRLQGGVKLSWDDDDSDLGVGIFVGSSFDLFSSN